MYSCQPAEFVIPNGGRVREGGVPPEAEENGTHVQGWEVNCNLQCMRCSTKSENAREC